MKLILSIIHSPSPLAIHPSIHPHTNTQYDRQITKLSACYMFIINTNCTAQTANCHIILYKHSYFFFSQFQVLNKAKERKFCRDTWTKAEGIFTCFYSGQPLYRVHKRLHLDILGTDSTNTVNIVMFTEHFYP